jgi:hypothetical protein
VDTHRPPRALVAPCRDFETKQCYAFSFGTRRDMRTASVLAHSTCAGSSSRDAAVIAPPAPVAPSQSCLLSRPVWRRGVGRIMRSDSCSSLAWDDFLAPTRLATQRRTDDKSLVLPHYPPPPFTPFSFSPRRPPHLTRLVPFASFALTRFSDSPAPSNLSQPPFLPPASRSHPRTTPAVRNRAVSLTWTVPFYINPS